MTDLVHISRQYDGEYGPGHWELAELAARQHNSVGHWQLRRMGLGQDAIEYRVRTGRLHPLFDGAYTLGSPAASPRGRLIAAVLACGPGAQLSHRSAGPLWELLRSARSVVDVTTLRGRCGNKRGIDVHRVRSLHPDDCAVIDGIPVTSLARTLLDLAEVISERRLVYAIEQAERMGIFDMAAVERLMQRSRGRRGLKRLRAALDATHPEAKYARSKPERDFLDFCKEHGLPAHSINAVVEGFAVDALWPQQRVIVELDSWSFHKGRRAFEDDRRRDAHLKLAGYTVLRVTTKWLEDEPEEVARTIRALLSAPLSPAATA